ncbi:unnamed protein product [Bursaphelenchus xylophilus]|uniref:(pine wood nematode) hypothetical protein n=1 Tax=Bursaphelenchus xylophilus TaxID=6326 RepID=A0A811JXY6_BURXY|nr:unnamed protein product [Bursaphelenchus xylophilus]CAG9081299.1 unnamed protein product [Bursaphelenchus xylophilus]
MQGAVEAETTQFPPPTPAVSTPAFGRVHWHFARRKRSAAGGKNRVREENGRKTRGSECTVHTKKGDVAKRKRNAIRECAESSAGIEERQEWRVRNASEWEAEKEHSAIERIAALCRQQRSLISVAMGNSSVPAS